MNILMLNYEYPPLGGGGGVVHQHIAEELSKRHKVTVVTSACKGLAPIETVGGVTVHRVKVVGRNALATASIASMLSYVPSAIRYTQTLINRERPDLINTHFAVPTGPAGVVLARRNRLPHALCIHGGDIFDPSKKLSPHRTPGLKQTVRWVLHRVDRVLAQSQNTAENARRIYGYSGDIGIIPHGLKEPDLSPVSRQEMGLRDEDIVLATVGRLVARKANDQLLRALAALNNARLRLVIIGDGPERESLNALALQLGIADRVTMPGFVTDEQKFRWLKTADIFVSATNHEGFGLMFVEAMFCSLPIITYNHGGQTDFIEHGRNGYMAPLNDERRFQDYLATLVTDGAARRAMGRCSREISNRLTIGTCAQRYEQEFGRLCSES